MIYKRELNDLKTRILADIISDKTLKSDDFSNVYSCVGDRGQGKSTFLKQLGKELNTEERIVLLKTIDPNLLEEKSGIFELLVFRLREYLLERQNKDENVDRLLNELDEFWEKYKAVIHIDKTNADEYYKDYEYRNVYVENTKKEKLTAELSEIIKGIIGSKTLILFVDDLDMTEINKIHDALFFMHKFLRCDNMKIVLSFSQEHMIEAIKSKIAVDRDFLVKASGEDIYQASINGLANRIYEKVIPTTNRVNLMFDIFDVNNSVETFFSNEIISTTYYSVQDELKAALKSFGLERSCDDLTIPEAMPTNVDFNISNIFVEKNKVNLNVSNFIEYIIFIKTGLSFTTDKKRRDNTWLTILSTSLRGVNHFIIKLLHMTSIEKALEWDGSIKDYEHKKRNIELLDYELNSNFLLQDVDNDLRRIYNNTFNSNDAIKKLIFYNDMVDYMNSMIDKEKYIFDVETDGKSVRMAKLSSEQIGIITIADIYNIINEASSFYYNQKGGIVFKVMMKYHFTSLLTKQLCDLKIMTYGKDVCLNDLHESEYYNTINKNIIPVHESGMDYNNNNLIRCIHPWDIIYPEFAKETLYELDARSDYQSIIPNLEKVPVPQKDDFIFELRKKLNEESIDIQYSLENKWNEYIYSEDINVNDTAKSNYFIAMLISYEMIISNRNFTDTDPDNFIKKSYLNSNFSNKTKVIGLDYSSLDMKQLKYADYFNVFTINALINCNYCFSNLFDIDILCSEHSRSSTRRLKSILNKYLENLKTKYDIFSFENDRKYSIISIFNNLDDILSTHKLLNNNETHVPKSTIYDNLTLKFDDERNVFSPDKVAERIIGKILKERTNDYKHINIILSLTKEISNKSLFEFINMTDTICLNNYRFIYKKHYSIVEMFNNYNRDSHLNEKDTIKADIDLIIDKSNSSTIFMKDDELITDYVTFIKNVYKEVIGINAGNIIKKCSAKSIDFARVSVDIILSLYAILYIRINSDEIKKEAVALKREKGGK